MRPLLYLVALQSHVLVELDPFERRAAVLFLGHMRSFREGDFLTCFHRGTVVEPHLLR